MFTDEILKSFFYMSHNYKDSNCFFLKHKLNLVLNVIKHVSMASNTCTLVSNLSKTHKIVIFKHILSRKSSSIFDITMGEVSFTEASYSPTSSQSRPCKPKDLFHIYHVWELRAAFLLSWSCHLQSLCLGGWRDDWSRCCSNWDMCQE